MFLDVLRLLTHIYFSTLLLLLLLLLFAHKSAPTYRIPPECRLCFLHRLPFTKHPLCTRHGCLPVVFLNLDTTLPDRFWSSRQSSTWYKTNCWSQNSISAHLSPNQSSFLRLWVCSPNYKDPWRYPGQPYNWNLLIGPFRTCHAPPPGSPMAEALPALGPSWLRGGVFHCPCDLAGLPETCGREQFHGRPHRSVPSSLVCLLTYFL